jgi:ferritin-like metal-binding protein YciE
VHFSGMAMTTQETLVKYLTDMYALESHLVQPLKSQAKDADIEPYPQARVLVQKMLARAENAQWALESLIKEMGGDARGSFKAAVTAAAGAVAAVVNEGRTHAITKKLRDDYTALSLVSIGYELLHTTGNALGSPQVAALAQASLKEVAGLIMELSQEIIPVAVAELGATTTVDASAVATSQQNILDAWRRH